MFEIKLSNCYAIYNEINGDVIGVSSCETEEKSIEIPRQLFRDITLNHKLMNDYVVSMDSITSLPVLVKRNIKSTEYTVSDNIYLIPSATDTTNCVVTQDNINKCWTIGLRNKENINATILPTQYCHFSVSLLNDIHYLIRNFSIPANKIVHGVSVPYINEYESRKVSVYTQRIFGNYGVETIYE